MIVGESLGSVELRQRLGRGGVGDVYLGFDTNLKREVAVKALRPEYANDLAFVRRFVAEAQNLARLNHPNIATLYSLHNDGRALCMIMEYIDGQTLDEISAAIALSEADAVAIAVQAVEGLRYAHAMGLIHRDIKPGNLMINRAGALKIMDFGIARLQGSERMTRQGAIIGSIAYMAPEQILGREGDERSDIYSLAIVLYELLCGAPPFAEDSEYAVMKAQIETAPRRLFEHLPAINPDLEAALMKALAKAPEERFSSVDDFHNALAPLMMTTVEAARLLSGRFAGQREVREDDPAECAGGSHRGFSGAAAPPRADQASPAPTPARTRLVDPSLLRRAIRVEWREILPRLALGVAAGVFAIMVGIIGITMMTNGSKRTDDSAAYAPEPKVDGTAIINRSPLEVSTAGPPETVPASSPAAKPSMPPEQGQDPADRAPSSKQIPDLSISNTATKPELPQNVGNEADLHPEQGPLVGVAPGSVPPHTEDVPSTGSSVDDDITERAPPTQEQTTSTKSSSANPWANSIRQR